MDLRHPQSNFCCW